jgi:hypothetical protein
MARRGFAAIAIALGLAVGLGAAGARAAGEDRQATDAEKAEVLKRLESLGYREIRDIEVDDGLLEAEATSPDGSHRVDLQFQLGTFEIVGRSRD